MKPTDIEFRKNCEKYHNKIRKLLKNGNLDKAKPLINEINKTLAKWEEELRSTRFKIGLLRTICADLVGLERRANYKDRRRQNNDPE